MFIFIDCFLDSIYVCVVGRYKRRIEKGIVNPGAIQYGCWELNSIEHTHKSSLQPVYSFCCFKFYTNISIYSILWLEIWFSDRVLGWQAKAQHSISWAWQHTLVIPALRWKQEGKKFKALFSYISTFPSAVFTLLVGKSQEVSLGSLLPLHTPEVIALMAWQPHLYLFTHDLPSHLTCTYLCAMLRFIPRPHTC